MSLRPTTVALVHPDAAVRQHLVQVLQAAGLEPVAAVGDAALAWSALQPRWPDVIVAAATVPPHGAVSLLDELLVRRPTPLVVCHAPGEDGDAAVLALANGAVDVIACGRPGRSDALSPAALAAVVRGAALARVAPLEWADTQTVPAPLAEPGGATEAFAPTAPGELDLPFTEAERVAVLAAGTGGVQALETVLATLPRRACAVVVLQPLGSDLSEAWARRLNQLCAPSVAVARGGEAVTSGRVLLVPAGLRATLRPRGMQLTVALQADAAGDAAVEGPADALLKSLAVEVGPLSQAVLLTGPGTDGARGLLAVKEARGRTAVQEERSCAVPSRVREAVRLGAPGETLTPAQLGGWLTLSAQTVNG